MPQITTYARKAVTEADVRAASERAREDKAKRLAEEREMAKNGPSDALMARAKEQVIADMKARGIEVPEPEPVPQAAPVDLSGLQAELDELVELNKKAHRGFYSGFKMMMGAAFRTQEYGERANKLAHRLGTNSPITSGVLNLGDSGGVPQEKLVYADLIFDRLKQGYRASGGVIAPEHFEGPMKVIPPLE